MNKRDPLSLAICLLLGAASLSAGTLYTLEGSTLNQRSATSNTGTVLSSVFLAGTFNAADELLPDPFNARLLGLFDVGAATLSIGVINTATGAVTGMFSLGGSTDYYTFDGAGNLFGMSSSQVFSINTSNGAFTAGTTMNLSSFTAFAPGAGAGLVLGGPATNGGIYDLNLQTGGTSLRENPSSVCCVVSMTSPLPDGNIFVKGFYYNAPGSGSGSGSGSTNPASELFRVYPSGSADGILLPFSGSSVAYLPDSRNFAPESSSLALLAVGAAGLLAARKYLR